MPQALGPPPHCARRMSPPPNGNRWGPRRVDASVHDGPGLKIRFAVSPGGGRFDAEGLGAFATAAETLGFDTIWLSDVPLGPIGDPLSASPTWPARPAGSSSAPTSCRSGATRSSSPGSWPSSTS